ncbi:hypothetical protein EON65_14080 [archaeon]|nr:MAG: hypothetical protein EON65_14080 [archaeon]
MMTPVIYLGFVVLLLLVTAIFGYNYSDSIKDYPTPFTEHNKVMGLILMFNLVHIDPFILILNEYLSMCEAGWDPTIVVFTAVDWSAQLQRLMRQKVYCYRTGKFVPIIISKHDASVGTALGAEHRKYMANHINTTDVFIYHEDDILVKLNHLVGYLYEIKKLHNLIPNEHGLFENTIGFQRFRRLFKYDGHQAYGENDVMEQELMEEMPEFRPICVDQHPYLVVRGNTHQAMWIFTKQQVLMLTERCDFLNQASASR